MGRERIEQTFADIKARGESAFIAYITAGDPTIDATVRLLPGVLGNAASTEEESFAGGLLEHPHYTRPAEWRGLGIPAVLSSGDHGKVAQWRREMSERLTRERRPDLWQAHRARDEDG